MHSTQQIRSPSHLLTLKWVKNVCSDDDQQRTVHLNSFTIPAKLKTKFAEKLIL